MLSITTRHYKFAKGIVMETKGTENVSPVDNELPEKHVWQTPAVTSFKPVSDTQGISRVPGDGISNLS
jgi:hypothetical protein